MKDDTLPLVSIVTVVFNDANLIAETLRSVSEQTYGNIEYIVIDGGSTDGTVDIIREYKDSIDFWLSEPDQGVYDAMNKGIEAASGVWLNFMNSGDKFVAVNSVSNAMKLASESSDVIYSDYYRQWGDETPPKKFSCNSCNLDLLHQSMIYRSSLHAVHGRYISTGNLITSDYIFFSLLDPNRFVKSDEPISINLAGGISSSYRHIQEKYVVDFIFNRSSLLKAIINIAYHSFGRSIKLLLNIK